MKKYLLGSYNSFPLMQIEDFIKQIYQAEYGCEHILDCNAENRMIEECRQFGDTRGTQQLFDTISSDLVRVNLRPYCERGYSLSTLSDLMRCVNRQGSVEGLERRLDQLKQLVQDYRIDLPLRNVARGISQYASNGYGAVRHSTAYRLNYNPHYRVILKKHAQLLPVIAKIDHMLYHKMNIIVAIDGNSCSGKSFYAEVLSQYYNNCNIIHCDDFFLPPSMRTQERLSTNGGNIHYERLREVLNNVVKDHPFSYQSYNCHSDSYSTIAIEPKRLTIVEGSYSLHSRLSNYYSMGVVLTVDPIEQRFRVSNRETIDSYNNYINKWIPLENQYLSALENRNYIRIDTTDIDY